MLDLWAIRARVAAVMVPGVHPRGDTPAAVARICASSLPGDGSAVTRMTDDTQRELLVVTDDVIASVERAQYRLGEGPALQAFATRRPVLVPDLEAGWVGARWPTLSGELAGLPIGSLFVFPMRLGAISVGVCSLYRTVATELSRSDVAFTLTVIDVMTLALLELHEGDEAAGLVEGAPPGGVWPGPSGPANARIHQATGMLVAQLGLNPRAAFARLRGEAFAAGRSLEQVADDIVGRRLRLDPDPP